MRGGLKSKTEGFYVLENHFSDAISLKSQVIGDCAIAYIGGIDAANFNVLLQRKAIQEPEIIINRAKEFFAKHDVTNWTYTVPSDLDTTLLRIALENHNFVFEISSTALCYSFDKHIGESQKTLTIQPVEPDNKDWLQILNLAFEGVGETTNQYSQALQRAKVKGVDMQHFMGSINNQPVATITLTFLNDIVRIDNVATHPNHQSLGYASQMVRFGLDFAKEKDSNHCFLDASPKGLGMYRRLGFSEIFTYNMYECK